MPKAPDFHESSSGTETDIDDDLDYAEAVPAEAAAEAVPAEAAAEVVQDAKAQPRHVPLCPICLEDLRVMTLWICSLVGAHPGPHGLTRVDQG